MTLGIGRGDSALAHLGRAPARLGWFENYLASLQAYLRGQEVEFPDTTIPDAAAPPAEKLGLAHGPAASAIRWIGDGPKVPVEVVATGPKVIGIAARQADRVLLAVGAEPKRVAWGMQTARRAAEDAGRDPEALRFGAYVNVVCHDDPAVGRELGRATTGLFARFSVMYGEISGPADERQAEVFHTLHDRYDMNAHGQSGGQQTTALTEEFIDGYAIVGGPEHCAARLGDLVELGIEKFAVMGPNFVAANPEAQGCRGAVRGRGASRGAGTVVRLASAAPIVAFCFLESTRLHCGQRLRFSLPREAAEYVLGAGLDKGWERLEFHAVASGLDDQAHARFPAQGPADRLRQDHMALGGHGRGESVWYRHCERLQGWP